MGKKEIKLLKQIFERVKEEGKLTGESFQKLHSIFGERFIRAWKTLQEKRVKKYVFKPSGKTVWIVVGKEKDYLILPEAEFCTCDDFYFRVMDHEVHLCYHLLAQKLADLLGLYEKIEESDEIYETLMKEWKEITNK